MSVALAQEVSLERVMAFQHPGLIARLQVKLNLNQEEAVSLFEDMKRFLFLCGAEDRPLAPPELIDEAWHNFILFTKDYARFCQEQFGKFIHHLPLAPGNRASDEGSLIRATTAAAKECFGESLSPNWSYGKAANCDKCSGSTNCQTQSRSECSGAQ
ncbi:hypothetical protein C4553_00590 [Candidatus Parcubacteria bacterium]|nr:MAG: hypothetical protein C4553_00590 [Candidatus Parcubacteria bacterium]